MADSRLTNWNRSIYNYILNNAGTPKDSDTFTFTDIAKPNGCGNVDVDIILGYPEQPELLTVPTIAIEDPMMPDNPQIGLIEEADLRIYVIYGIIVKQEMNFNKRLRDRLAERFRDIFKKGTYIQILDFENVNLPKIDDAWVEYRDVKILKSASYQDADKFRFSCTVNIRGYYNG